MTILERITRGPGRSAAAAEPLPSVDAALFVYIKIPEDIGPLDRGLLPKLGAPAGTALHYTRGTSRLQDVYDSGEWAIGRPREMLHPGFGI